MVRPLDFIRSRARNGDLHEQFFDILLASIGLHMLAITAYAVVFRLNLVTPMSRVIKSGKLLQRT